VRSLRDVGRLLHRKGRSSATDILIKCRRTRLPVSSLRRAFSLTFRAGLYPLSGRRLLAAVADSVLANAGSGRRWRRRGRRRGGELSELPGRRAQHPDRDRTGMGVPVPPTSTALRCWAMNPPPARSLTSVSFPVDAALELAVERKRRPISKGQNLRHEHSGDAASSDRSSNRC
jgi:hypothetical protein